MVRHAECPLCSSAETGHFLSCRDWFLSKEEFSIIECGACGFRFTRDHPGEAEAGRYYESSDYISHSSSKRNAGEKIYHLARKIMLGRKVSFIRKASARYSGNLLDIGSGTGHFAAAMKNAGWNVSAIEINEKAREFSERELGIAALPPEKAGSLEDGSFDCITLWHVLEHFHDLHGYMKEIKRLLRPGGTLVVALPNSDSADARLYGKFWAAWDVPRHLWHFTPSSFAKLAELHGFAVRRSAVLPLDVFYISWLSEKYKGSAFPLPKGILMALVPAAKSIFSKDKGSSLVYTLSQA
ncbi:MAG: class I SAM-dependent methyltransferase [Bacteroidales bacterium]|jgi:SAM-dependent methyltransferase|nr:class I SAM-dependent methyltransferase [Bacteroidales bacterium]